MQQRMIERCNAFIWGFMFSGGFDLDHASLQHRDLVRTFFAGVLEMAMALKQPDTVRSLMPLYESMCAETWLPGPEFSRAAWDARKPGGEQ